MKRISQYLIATILVILYIVILIISLDTSGASEWYRLFYSDQKLKFFVNESNLKTYTMNVPMVYRTDGNFLNEGKGWSGAGDKGAWAEGQESEFFLYIEGECPDCVLQMNILNWADYPYRLIVNGQDITDFHFEKGENLLSVPGTSLKQGFNSFVIRTLEPVVPYNQMRPKSEMTKLYTFKVSEMQLIFK